MHFNKETVRNEDHIKVVFCGTRIVVLYAEFAEHIGKRRPQFVEVLRPLSFDQLPHSLLKFCSTVVCFQSSALPS